MKDNSTEPKPFVFQIDGQMTQHSPENGKHYTLEELQKLVGGYIQMITLPEDMVMVINEEGKMNRLPLNTRATELAVLSGSIYPNDFIVGVALICPRRLIK